MTVDMHKFHFSGIEWSTCCIPAASNRNGILPQTEAEKGKFEAACKRNAFGRKIHSMAICNGISQCSFRDAALGEINW